MIHSSYDELRDATYGHANHQKDASAANFRDDTAVDNDDHYTDSSHDARHAKRVIDVSHFEEVCTVS